jgi:DNA-binding response OmpR family regulator
MIDILIAEDDTLFAQTLEDFLTEEGFSVDLCHSGTEAEERCYEKHYDLLLLDINMPGLNGLDLLKTLRNRQNSTPAIYLTSYKEKGKLMEGFSAGADDYLRKPIDLDELLMRIHALLKRTHKAETTVTIGNCQYDREEKVLITEDGRIPLTKKLAALLDIFTENPNRIVTKEQIKARVWEWDEAPSDGALRVYVNDLKKLIGKTHIENIKGVGYRFVL